uniref:AMP-binding enzyme n=1 Tax=Ruegeria discodermiae TaxID=3064389 RepID=UPI0035324DE9
MTCASVDAAVTACDGVAECACIGQPDEKTGELVSAFVVRAPGAEVTEEQISRIAAMR